MAGQPDDGAPKPAATAVRGVPATHPAVRSRPWPGDRRAARAAPDTPPGRRAARDLHRAAHAAHPRHRHRRGPDHPGSREGPRARQELAEPGHPARLRPRGDVRHPLGGADRAGDRETLPAGHAPGGGRGAGRGVRLSQRPGAERRDRLAAHAGLDPQRDDRAGRDRRQQRRLPHLPGHCRRLPDDHRLRQPAQPPDRRLGRADRVRHRHRHQRRRHAGQPGRDPAAGPPGRLRLALGARRRATTGRPGVGLPAARPTPASSRLSVRRVPDGEEMRRYVVATREHGDLDADSARPRPAGLRIGVPALPAAAAAAGGPAPQPADAAPHAGAGSADVLLGDGRRDPHPAPDGGARPRPGHRDARPTSWSRAGPWTSSPSPS